MQTPLVSVIIPTYNGVKYIHDTIASALAQTYNHREIIVIDDGSTDDTVEAVRRTFDERVILLQKSNGGPASARNHGIRRARGKYIALLDHDDLWLAEKLALQVEMLENQPETALVFSNAYLFDAASQHDAGTFFEIDAPARGRVFSKLLMRNFIPNLTVVVRKAIFDRFGLFDETGRALSADDYHKWLEVALHYPIDFIDKPLARFRQHAHNYSNDLPRSIRETFFIVDEIFEKGGALVEVYRHLQRQRHADLYYRLARWQQRRGDYRAAAQNALLALRSQPSFWKAAVLYAYVALSRIGKRNDRKD